MVVCDDANELKIVVRCVVVACKEALTVDELWKKLTHVFGGPHCVQLNIFGYDTFFDYLKSIPDVVQLEEPDNENSLINLVSSELSRHMELLVCTNITRPPSLKNKIAHRELLIPYQIQCAFMRVMYELYPKGLSIDDFVSDILCIPIFKSFDNVDVLLFNLDHIFKRNLSEIINLRPTILDVLKCINEEDKFSAADIFNIDEYSLEDSNKNKILANGLEYPFFNLLEEPIKNNIEKLLDEDSGWISENKICGLYIEKFGSSFAHYRRWGFSRVSQMFTKLPELCSVSFLNENDVEIISSKKYIDNKDNLIKDQNDLEKYLICEKEKSEKVPEEHDGVLKSFLRKDKLLEASLTECFLDPEIQHIKFQINQSLNVKVCRVNTNFMPTIICQSLDNIHKLQDLLIEMKKFYFINESKFIFDPTSTVIKNTYAFSFNDLWFRGTAIDNNSCFIEMVDIDDGSIHNVSYDDIRILYKPFSQLPAQSFTCYLNGIESVDKNVLTQIVDKKCIVHIISIEQLNKAVSVKIKLENSTSNEYLNDEWIKNGFAAPECSSDEEQK